MTDLETVIRSAQANGLDELRVRWVYGPEIQVIAVHCDARGGPWSVVCGSDAAKAIRSALEAMPHTGRPAFQTVSDPFEDLL